MSYLFNPDESSINMELIIEQNGREKIFKIDKGVTKVGSASICDIKLPPQIGAPLQLQIFYAVQQPDFCRVLNIGPEILVNYQGNRQKLASSANFEMRNGAELFIDNCKLTFKLPAASGVTRTSSSIDASLSFPNPVLYPDSPSVGTLTVRNKGKSASCQFQVRVSGLPGECFRVDPPPVLHPNGQGQSLVHLFHRVRYPQAGFHELKLIVSASDTYPGEEVVIRQQIYVKHVFDAKIELLDDRPPGSVLEKHPAASFSRSDSESFAAPIAAVSPAIVPSVDKVRKLEQNIPEDYWTDTDVE